MRLLRPLATAFLFALLATGVLSAPAMAHTGFESSEPADGETVDGPIEVVRLTFTGEAEPTGTGFEVLDPAGQVRTPTAVESDDGITWQLRFDPPLEGGTVGIRWMVKAPDAHPIDGGFSFTATSAAVVADDATTTAADRATTPASSTLPSRPDVQVEVEDGAEAAPTLATTNDPEDATSTTELDRFLDDGGGSTALATRLAAGARLATLIGTVLGVGGLVFAGWVLRGEPRDTAHVLAWLRRAGVLTVVGVTAELVAQLAIEAGGDWASGLSPGGATDVMLSPFGAAVALRLLGGVSLITGARGELVDAGHVHAERSSVGELSRVGAVVAGGSSEPTVGRNGSDAGHLPADRPGPVRGSATSPVAAAGAVALVLAHLFDGHTVVEGHRLWTGLADVLHVIAGAVWVGGVLMLATVLWRRHRRGQRPRARALALRFSVVAAAALSAAGLAGVALAVIVLDSPSELWSTDWGRTLVAKTVLVALAAVAGGYNHRVLLPALTNDPDDPAVAARFRATVSFEALVLIGVLGSTALLMGAAS